MTADALEGLKVLDLSTMFPGPYCSLVLGDLGADVVKVEPPGHGDPMRGVSAAIFASVNRNKRSVVLDLKAEAGRAVLRQLAGWADVVLEGFRPGVAARLGADYETLSAGHPDLVYCSISGYGQDGPYRDWVGHDLNYVGVSGALAVGGDPDGPDEWSTSIPVADIAGGMFAAVTVLAACLSRARTGRGQYIDVALADTMVAMTGLRIADYFSRGRPTKSELIAKGALGVFAARDGKRLTLAALEDRFFRNLCATLERQDLQSDPRFVTRAARSRHWRALRACLEEALLARDRDDWVERLTAADVPCAPANGLDDLLDDGHLRARRVLLRDANGSLHVGFPARLSGTPWRLRRTAPRLGEHTDEVLKMLGWDDARIRELHHEEVT